MTWNDAEYVLQIKYDEALNTNIQGNNSAKVIGKNVYYYLKTADDALNEAEEIPLLELEAGSALPIKLATN